jgi:hypothetical protein
VETSHRKEENRLIVHHWLAAYKKKTDANIRTKKRELDQGNGTLRKVKKRRKTEDRMWK